MGMTMELKGFTAIEKAIVKYSTDKLKEIGDQVEISSRAIEQTAKKVVPVDTGRLRASIKVLPLGFSFEKTIEARTHYAIHVEFNNKSYLRVAYHKHKKGFDRAIKRILEK